MKVLIIGGSGLMSRLKAIETVEKLRELEGLEVEVINSPEDIQVANLLSDSRIKIEALDISMIDNPFDAEFGMKIEEPIQVDKNEERWYNKRNKRKGK